MLPNECCTLWRSRMVCLATLRCCACLNSGAPALLLAKKQWLAWWKSLECTTTLKRVRWHSALMPGMISAAPDRHVQRAVWRAEVVLHVDDEVDVLKQIRCSRCLPIE